MAIKSKRLPLPLRLVIWCVAAVIIIYLSLFAYVCISESTVPEPPATDLMIVLGAQVKPDGTPSVQLMYRLTAALEAYRAHPQTVVCCGGQAGQEPEAEGTVMVRWLKEQGIPESDLLAETKSGDTKENIANALSMVQSTPGKVLIVTSDYHVPRAVRIARDAHLDAYGKGGKTLPEYWFKNRAREALAWGKYLLYRIIGR